MSNNNYDFTLWKLSWPIFIQLLLTFSLMLTDSFFLSSISDSHAASIGAVFPILAIGYMIFNQLGFATTNVASQYLGSGKTKGVSSIYYSGLILCAVTGSILGFIVWGIHSWIGSTIGLEANEAGHVSLYLSIVGPALLFEALKSSLNGIVAANGKTKLSMYGAIFYNLLNILLNSVFVFGLFGFDPMGVLGVAIATVISQFCLVLLLALIVISQGWLKSSGSITLKVISQSSKKIANIGFPASLEPVSIQLLGVILAYIIIAFGIKDMAARTYVFNYISLLIAWTIAIGVGTQIIVARAVGAQDWDAVNRQLKSSLTLTSGVTIGFVTISLVFANILFSLFSQDAHVLYLCKLLLIGCIIWEPIRAANVVLSSSLVAAGDARFCSIFGSIIMWGVGLPLCYLLGFKLDYGLLGLWYALIADEAIRLILYLARFKSNIWKEKRLDFNNDESSPSVV